MFARLGRWCHDRRGVVVILWVAVLLVGGIVLGGVGTNTKSEFELPNVESKQGSDILDRNFGGQGAGFGGTIVFRSDRPVTDPAVREPLETFFDEVDDHRPTSR